MVGDVAVMLDESVLRCFVIVGGDGKNGVGAGTLGFPGEHDGGHRVVAAGAGDDFNTLIDAFDAEIHSFHMLFQRHRGTFTRCAANRDGGGAAGNMKFYELTQFFIIDFA